MPLISDQAKTAADHLRSFKPREDLFNAISVRWAVGGRDDLAELLIFAGKPELATVLTKHINRAITAAQGLDECIDAGEPCEDVWCKRDELEGRLYSLVRFLDRLAYVSAPVNERPTGSRSKCICPSSSGC